MKRFLTTFFITLALVVGAAGVAPAAHAQEGDMGGTNSVTGTNEATPGTTAAGCLEDPGDPGVFYDAETGEICTGAAKSALSTGDPAAEKTTKDLPPNPDPGEGFGRVMTWIMSLFAWLVGVAVVTLDYAVYYTVVTMGNYVNNLSAIGVTWQIMRDIGNIVIIFGFLAVGITIIISREDWYGGGKKMLPMLLVAAVFINFSLFLTEAVIDTGNLFATQFYTQIKGGNLPTSNYLGGTSFMKQIEQDGVSNKIMAQLGLQTIYTKALEPNTQVFKAGNTWIIGFMGIILFLITAFVMFSLAFILIARFVILLFLIIIAPIGFAGLAVPQLKGVADKWWSKLFEQTITAPVLLLCLYIALRIITDVNFLTGFCTPSTSSGSGACTKNLLGFVEGNDLNGFASFILSFLVAMGLLLAVVILSKKMSAFGGAGATKLASKLSGVSLAAAAPGWMGRHTAGLSANYAAKKLRGTAFGRSFVGRGFADTLEKKVASASFDVRNTSIGKSAAEVSLDLGKGQKGGYKADLEERVKSYERAAAGITGGAKEREEKEAAKQAKANKEEKEKARDNAKEEHNKVAPALQQERDRLNAEVEQLEKEKAQAGVGTFRANEIDKKLAPAREARDKSAAALKAADDKLAKAESDLTAATKDETDAIKGIGNAKKDAQKKYADRLENKWGPVWVFGTAAAVAAPRVRGSIGKSKTEQEVEALLKSIKEKTGESEPEAEPKKEEKK